MDLQVLYQTENGKPNLPFPLIQDTLYTISTSLVMLTEDLRKAYHSLNLYETSTDTENFQ